MDETCHCSGSSSLGNHKRHSIAHLNGWWTHCRFSVLTCCASHLGNPEKDGGRRFSGCFRGVWLKLIRPWPNAVFEKFSWKITIGVSNSEMIFALHHKRPGTLTESRPKITVRNQPALPSSIGTSRRKQLGNGKTVESVNYILGWRLACIDQAKKHVRGLKLPSLDAPWKRTEKRPGVQALDSQTGSLLSGLYTETFVS